MNVSVTNWTSNILSLYFDETAETLIELTKIYISIYMICSLLPIASFRVRCIQ